MDTIYGEKNARVLFSTMERAESEIQFRCSL